jgi:hypothetical protein
VGTDYDTLKTITRDADLKQYLEAMEMRINSYTAGQVDSSGQRLNAHMAGKIDASELRIKAHTSQECEKVETKLLTEFHK